MSNKAARALAEQPASRLGWDDPLFALIFAEATGGLSEQLDAVALQYQQRDEAGIRLLHRLHLTVPASTLSALALTGFFIFPPMARRAQRQRGAFAYLDKPFDKQQIVAVIERATQEASHD